METTKSEGLSRRDFMKLNGVAAAAAGFAMANAGCQSAEGKHAGGQVSVTPALENFTSPLPSGRYNVLFILTDQEQYWPGLLGNGHWPGRDRLARSGTTFENHQICAAVCTPSRSVIFTGQHIQHTSMFDNTNFPWAPDMSFDIPTIGHMMREAGYYTTYQGKWHLHRQLHVNFPTEDGRFELVGHDTMEKYGFSDFTGIGDHVGGTLGGYHTDQFVTATTQAWLRGKGKPLNTADTPWFCALSRVNPHDVMYYNTDLPGQNDQAGGRTLLGQLSCAPEDRIYNRQWNVPLAATRNQAWDAPGRPNAHREYQQCRSSIVGKIPNEEQRWRRLQNYYLNCISDCDRSVDTILTELENLGMLSNTIVILTSDHGELCGAHGMSGKGATAYREQNNVPLIIHHPAVPGGRKCQAVTSHLDLVPTILSMTGADRKVSKKTLSRLHGRDISPVLKNPGTVRVDSVRDGALYCFNMWSYMDADWLGKIGKALAEGQPLTKDTAPRPDFRKRSAIRSVFDGRYRFSRYFSMTQHNRPTTFEQLLRANDVELYDLKEDPLEVTNLAVDRRTHRDLLMAMNEKLNSVMDREVGEDDGRFLPDIDGVNWAIDRFDG